MKSYYCIALLLSLFLLSGSITSWAHPLETVKESFDYELGDLDGMGSNTMGWDESWLATTGYVNVVDGNLAPDTEGRHIETEADFAPAEVYRFRYLKDTWPDSGRPYWMGFVFQRKDDGTISSWGGLSLMMDDTELLFMGSPWQKNAIGIDCMGIQIATGIPDTVLSWLVMKFDMNGTAERDSIFLWVNPDPSVEPDTKLADGRGDWNGSNGFNRIRLGNDAQYVLAYDMIRLGTSFDAVKPVGTSVDGHSRQTLPASPILMQNYPNPFNPSTIIAYTLYQTENVTLEIYSILGTKVRTLECKTQTAGEHTVQWNGLDDFGRVVPAGLYIYRLTAGQQRQTRKMILAR
jgi:hypothetical protein